MIAIGIVGMIWSVLMALAGLLPTITLPSALDSGGSAFSVLGTIGTNASGFSAWIDLTAVATVIAAMIAVMAAAIVIWFFRRVGAGIPWVGGFFQD